MAFPGTGSRQRGNARKRIAPTKVVTAREVRRLALSLPETEERPHRGRASFHVRGTMLAALLARKRRAVMKLSPDERAVLAEVQPGVFRHAVGEERGWTSIDLERVDPWLFEELLVSAWRRLASGRAIAAWNARRGRW